VKEKNAFEEGSKWEGNGKYITGSGSERGRHADLAGRGTEIRGGPLAHFHEDGNVHQGRDHWNAGFLARREILTKKVREGTELPTDKTRGG